MAEDAKRDQNRIPTLLAVSNVDGLTPVRLWADPVTHRLLVDFPAGTGDVVGPAGATADDIVLFDGATGKLIKDSGAKLSDYQTSLGFTPENVANKSTSVSTDGSSDTKYPSVKAVKDYADGLVSGLLDYRGGYDASGNTYPTTGGSGTAGAVMKGDLWIISVAGSLGGTAVQIGDSVIANTDTPGQTAGNWNILNGNISYVPEDVANKVTSISGSSTDTQYPSAKLVYDQLALKSPLASPTFTGTVTLPKTTEIQDTSADHQYVLAVNELTADRTVTLPLLTGNDEFTFNAHTQTLTNKRINPRLVTAASYTTDTGTSLNIANCDQFEVTAQAGALKFNNPGGTPLGGQKLIIRIKDDGTARALTYDTQFRAMGNDLPSTTVLSKTLYMGFIYNATDTKWDLVAVAQEA